MKDQSSRDDSGLGMVAVLAVQVWEQEHQRKRERTDKHGNPCPHFEAAASALGNSTGRIDRSDKNGQGNGIHDGRSHAALGMKLVARRPAVKTLPLGGA